MGTNDIRLSDLATDGDPNFSTHEPALAANTSSNRMLVAWHGRETGGVFGDSDQEIFGQRFEMGSSAAAAAINQTLIIAAVPTSVGQSRSEGSKKSVAAVGTDSFIGRPISQPETRLRSDEPARPQKSTMSLSAKQVDALLARMNLDELWLDSLLNPLGE